MYLAVLGEHPHHAWAALYREIGKNCPRCGINRNIFLEAAFVQVRESQLAIAPPFAQMDLFGPVQVFEPGRERNTRSQAALYVKCWVMVIVFPTTRMINMHVFETSMAYGMISGITRLGCEFGVPKKLFIDQDSASICG